MVQCDYVQTRQNILFFNIFFDGYFKRVSCSINKVEFRGCCFLFFFEGVGTVSVHSLAHLNQALSVYLTAPTQKYLFWLCLQVRLGLCNGSTAWPQWKISVNCPFQGHNDSLPVRESNRESATFRSISRRSTTALSLPVLK